MNETKSKPSLYEALFPTPKQAEEKEYRHYFSRDTWSIDEFSALMVGITPHRLKEIRATEITLENIKDIRKSSEATEIIGKFLKSFKSKSDIDELYFFNDTAYLSPWKFIKWLALNNIKIRNRFCSELPIHLLELYLFFHPENIKSIAQGKNLIEFHRNLYRKFALNILETHPDISREELYQRCKPAEAQFKDAKGKRKGYKKRTLKNEWLKEVHLLRRGRPKKRQKSKLIKQA